MIYLKTGRTIRLPAGTREEAVEAALKEGDGEVREFGKYSRVLGWVERGKFIKFEAQGKTDGW